MSISLVEFSADTVVVATPKQLSSELEGESVILHLDSGIYYGLNEVGARIWELIQQPCSLSCIKSSLLKEYQVSEADCTQALVDILKSLQRADLVEVHNEAM